MRTRYAKLVQTRSGQGTKELSQRDQWIVDTFSFLRPHIVRCPTRTSKVSLFMFQFFNYYYYYFLGYFIRKFGSRHANTKKKNISHKVWE